MSQTKTQTILPPISRKNYPLMNAKSAPLSPRFSKTCTNVNTDENPNFPTQRTSTTRKRMTQRRNISYHLPPASRTTIALNPDFNEFTDPTELTLISRELKRQIINAKRELIPYKEELRRLQYFYNPNAFDPTIKSMNEKKSELETEKKEVDDQLNTNRRACQGSIFADNELQNETLKQKYHEKCIILERFEARLDKKKEKLDQILNSQTAESIVDANSKIKELTKKLKELKEEGDQLYVQNLKQLSKVGATQTTESQKLEPYRKNLSEEEHNVEKKKGELRVLRNEHQKKVAELKNSIAMKRDKEERIKRRDTWKQRLNLVNKNDEDKSYDEEEQEADDYNYENEENDENVENEREEEEAEAEIEGENDNEIHPPKSSYTKSPRRTKLNDIIGAADGIINNDTNEEEEEEGIENNEEEGENENNRNEEEEEAGENSNKDIATTAPVAPNTKDGDEDVKSPYLIIEHLEKLENNENSNDQQKGLTQPPPKV